MISKLSKFTFKNKISCWCSTLNAHYLFIYYLLKSAQSQQHSILEFHKVLRNIHFLKLKNNNNNNNIGFALTSVCFQLATFCDFSVLYCLFLSPFITCFVYWACCCALILKMSHPVVTLHRCNHPHLGECEFADFKMHKADREHRGRKQDRSGEADGRTEKPQCLVMEGSTC